MTYPRAANEPPPTDSGESRGCYIAPTPRGSDPSGQRFLVLGYTHGSCTIEWCWPLALPRRRLIPATAPATGSYVLLPSIMSASAWASATTILG